MIQRFHHFLSIAHYILQFANYCMVSVYEQQILTRSKIRFSNTVLIPVCNRTRHLKLMCTMLITLEFSYWHYSGLQNGWQEHE